MTRKSMAFASVTVYAVAMMTLVVRAAVMMDENIALDQVPQAARTVLQDLAGDAAFTELETERSNGVTVYEAEWKVNGVEHEAAVLADGTLIETEQEISAHSAPAGVRQAIAAHFGADARVSVEMKTIVLYEIEGRAHGKKLELMFSPTGRLIGGDDDDGDDDDDDDDDEDDDD